MGRSVCLSKSVASKNKQHTEEVTLKWTEEIAIESVKDVNWFWETNEFKKDMSDGTETDGRFDFRIESHSHFSPETKHFCQIGFQEVVFQNFHCSSCNCYHGCSSGCHSPTDLKLEEEQHLSPSKRALLDGSLYNNTLNGHGKIDDGVYDGRLDCGIAEEGEIGIGECEDGMLGDDGTGEDLISGDAVNKVDTIDCHGRDEKKPVEDDEDDKGSSDATDASQVDDERSNDGSIMVMTPEAVGNEEGTSSGSARVLNGILKKSSQLGESSHSGSNSWSSHLRECPSASNSMNKRVRWMPTERLVQVHEVDHSLVDDNHELRKCGVCTIL